MTPPDPAPLHPAKRLNVELRRIVPPRFRLLVAFEGQLLTRT